MKKALKNTSDHQLLKVFFESIFKSKSTTYLKRLYLFSAFPKLISEKVLIISFLIWGSSQVFYAQDFTSTTFQLQNAVFKSNYIKLQGEKLFTSSKDEYGVNYLWEVEPIDAVWFRLKKIESEDLYLNSKKGNIESMAIHSDSITSHWKKVKIVNNKYRIENKFSKKQINIDKGELTFFKKADNKIDLWDVESLDAVWFRLKKTGTENQYLNAEKGYLECSAVPEGYFTSHWKRIKMSNNKYRIENRYFKKKVLSMDKGILELSISPNNSGASQWNFIAKDKLSLELINSDSISGITWNGTTLNYGTTSNENFKIFGSIFNGMTLGEVNEYESTNTKKNLNLRGISRKFNEGKEEFFSLIFYDLENKNSKLIISSEKINSVTFFSSSDNLRGWHWDGKTASYFIVENQKTYLYVRSFDGVKFGEKYEKRFFSYGDNMKGLNISNGYILYCQNIDSKIFLNKIPGYIKYGIPYFEDNDIKQHYAEYDLEIKVGEVGSNGEIIFSTYFSDENEDRTFFFKRKLDDSNSFISTSHNNFEKNSTNTYKFIENNGALQSIKIALEPLAINFFKTTYSGEIHIEKVTLKKNGIEQINNNNKFILSGPKCEISWDDSFTIPINGEQENPFGAVTHTCSKTLERRLYKNIPQTTYTLSLNANNDTSDRISIWIVGDERTSNRIELNKLLPDNAFLKSNNPISISFDDYDVGKVKKVVLEGSYLMNWSFWNANFSKDGILQQIDGDKRGKLYVPRPNVLFDLNPEIPRTSIIISN